MRSYVPEYRLREADHLHEALQMLASHPEARPIAGGTDLMVLFNAGKLTCRELISVRRLPELRGIEVSGAHVSVGGAATYTELRAHETLQKEFPLLCQAASWTGGIANQNRGTLGGNIANASPAADSAPVLLAYDAELELASPRGKRRIAYRDFHTGYKQMQLHSGELISRILLPRSSDEYRCYGRKVGTRRAQAISKISFAAVCRESVYRIAIGSVAPTPVRCYQTEQFLSSNTLGPAVIGEARRILLRDISPITDLRSTRDYRIVVSQNLLSEFLESLLADSINPYGTGNSRTD